MKKEEVKSVSIAECIVQPTSVDGIVSINDYLEKFGEKLRFGIESIQYAAKVYAQALLKFPTTAATKFADTYPEVNGSTWDLLERIGNGALNAHAILLPFSVADKVSRIPIEKQNKMFEGHSKGFKVVSVATKKSRIVPLSHITPSQASLLIDMENGKIRSVEEQLRIIEDSVTATPSPSRSGGYKPKYQILGNVVRIGNVELGRETLRNILREMDERSKK